MTVSRSRRLPGRFLHRLKARTIDRRSKRSIAASGFFDPAWYQSTHPDIDASGTSLLTHYLNEGFRQGRNPGPLFDGARYLQNNPDVANAGVNPLGHFLYAPPSEGRTVSTLPVPAPSGRENLEVELRSTIERPPKLAIMVHAFYAETFDTICGFLANLPIPFSLMVSVPTSEARGAAVASVKKHRLGVDLDVRICPNRGRNFAPILAEFAGRISEYEVVLHLHTKKSLYTGSDQTGWRDQLIRSLVGSPAVVLATLQLLEGRSDVGLVYPSTTSSLSYWAHHWLGNANQAKSLFSRLGVDRYPAEGYFAYPVGGMFWARVDAIRPLLDAGLTFDDFPAEEGQNDGTLAHAIERSFVPLVHGRGFRFVEFDAGSGAFRLDWSALNLEQYLAFSYEGLCEAIDEADTVSFDIFDTILTRLSVYPDSVMRSVELRLRREFPEAVGFFDRRKAAEIAAREAKGWVGDVTLSDIYRQFPVDDLWNEEVINTARMLEVDSELASSVPRSVVIKALAFAANEGKRVIAVSDTYLERSQIDQLLKAAGVLELIDEVYLSSETGLRKDRGDMWEFLRGREMPASGRWLHVGDNERSDIQAATDRGISTYHCMSPATLVGIRGLPQLTALDSTHWGNDLLMGPTVAHIANDPFPDTGHFQPVDIPSPSDVGYAVFGPVVMAFLAWVARRPEIGGVDHLYFLSREGYLLRDAWEKIRAAGSPDLPASTYLFTSRRSSMASAQGVRFLPEEILEGSDFAGSFSELLSSRLGLNLDPGSPIADMQIELPEDEIAAQGILEGLRSEIVAHGAAEREHFTRYLEKIGLSSSKSPAVVDIGYSGTIQKHLQTVLDRGLTGFYMGTIARAMQVEDSGGSEFGFFAQDHPEWSTPSLFLRHSLVLEAFLTAPHGQTERTEIRDGEVTHSLRRDHRSAQELAIMDQLRKGALSYCDDILAAYGATILDVPIDPDIALSMVAALASGVVRSPRVRSALVVDDDYCGVPRRVVQLANFTPVVPH